VSGVHPTPYPIESRGSYLGVNGPECTKDHSPISCNTTRIGVCVTGESSMLVCLSHKEMYLNTLPSSSAETE